MPGSPTALRRARAALVIAALGAAGACVGERPNLATGIETTATTAASTTTTLPASPTKVAQARTSPIDVFEGASTTTPVRQITAEEATAAPDIPIVFLVKDESEDRLEVYLPTSPPGSTAWIREADVTLASVRFRIEVSLSEHRLRVFDDDEAVLDEPVSIGTGERPEAGVTYYVKELLQPPDQDGPYGAYVYGLSGFSTGLASIEEGSGVVGIHGTDDPGSLGEDVPTGSIGLANDAIARLVDDLGLPLGTPVEVLE